jgi:propanediol dehydratase small subunit
MVEGIANSLSGLQKASQQADTASRRIASYPSASTTQDVVDISDAALAEGSLESSVVMLKTAALMYKANAQALAMQLEAQADAFEELI